MTFDDFKPIFAVCIAGCGIDKPPSKETILVYFDLLGDLSPDILRAAIRQALLKHTYRSLPPVGLIRQLATEIKRPTVDAAKAWELAMIAVKRFGMGKGRRVRNGQEYDYDNMIDAIASLPPVVAEAVRRFGYEQICNATEETVGIVRTKFVEAYGITADRAEHVALMPPKVREIAGNIAEGWMDVPFAAPKQLAIAPETAVQALPAPVK